MNYYVIIISYLYVHDGKNKTIVQPYNIRESMIIVSSNIDKEQKYRQQAGMVDYLRSISMTSERVTSTRTTIYREQLKIVMRLVIFFSGSNQWKFDILPSSSSKYQITWFVTFFCFFFFSCSKKFWRHRDTKFKFLVS